MKFNYAQVGTELKTINYGGCFIHDNVLYIKTDAEKQQPDPDFIKIMVVDLEDGTGDYLFSDTLVIPVEAEINFRVNWWLWKFSSIKRKR